MRSGVTPIRPLRAAARQDVEAGHAHRDPHFDLFGDRRADGIVGDAAVDLDPAVHRAGVHDDRIGLGAGEALWGEAVERVIFAREGR
jgi:hypothetical protein